MDTTSIALITEWSQSCWNNMDAPPHGRRPYSSVCFTTDLKPLSDKDWQRSQQLSAKPAPSCGHRCRASCSEQPGNQLQNASQFHCGQAAQQFTAGPTGFDPLASSCPAPPGQSHHLPLLRASLLGQARLGQADHLRGVPLGQAPLWADVLPRGDICMKAGSGVE